MSLPPDPAALAGYRQAALVGAGSGADLAPLAWLAARGRFSRPPAPAGFVRLDWPDDSRAIVPEAARAPLRHLLASRDARVDGPYALRISRELRARGLRLHPFDLKPLEGFVARHADRLGRHAQAWLARVRPAQADFREPYGEDVDAMSEESFAAATRGEKIAFLRRRRGEDPGRARAFVDQAIDAEAASVRAGMVAALEIGLGPDDMPLLARLAEDRAASVRDAANALLARVPGSEAYEARKRDAAGWLELKTSLRRVRTLRVKPPPTLPAERVEGALAAAFEGVEIADIAAPFGLSPDALARAARDDGRLARIVLARAVREDAPSLVGTMLDGAGLDQDDALAALADGLPALPAARREAMASATLRSATWVGLPSLSRLEALHGVLDFPLSAPIATALLGSEGWRRPPWRDDDRVAPPTVEIVAALLPESAAAAFLDGLTPALRRRPGLFFEILGALPQSGVFR